MTNNLYDLMKNWPNKNDRLFIADGDTIAILNSWLNKDWLYADGYKKAADILIEYIKNKKVNADFLVYPIIFLYRHSIEINLKIICEKGDKLFGFHFTKNFFISHNLIKYWDECKKICINLFPKASNAFKNKLNNIERIIKELDKVDHKSITFRYHKDANGNPTIIEKIDPFSFYRLNQLNLSNLYNVMHKLNFFFVDITKIIYDKLTAKRIEDKK